MYIALAIIVIILLYIVTSYNGFVTLVNRTKEAASDIEVQLKRRYDLIPNLVNTVKGYATHESGTLEKVIVARNTAMQSMGEGGATMAQKADAENQLSGTLKSLFALSENYPDLKANASFIELQRELTDTEDKIQSSRRFYNGNVRDLNTALEHFPGNIIASTFHFAKMEMFDLPDGDAAQKPVEVKF
jgi:LemA protein